MLIPSLLALTPSVTPKPKSTKSSASTSTSTSNSNSDPSLTTLYVGNLPYKASEESIKQLFADIGKVESVRLMKDRKTGRRKGFGFVEVEAQRLDEFITKLNDHEFMDRTIKVRPAKDKAA
jgi:RNA recognition motif-containing protein